MQQHSTKKTKTEMVFGDYSIRGEIGKEKSDRSGDKTAKMTREADEDRPDRDKTG